MKFFATVSLFAGLGAALPTAREAVPVEEGIEARQLFGNTRNELQNGGNCPSVIFIFARGSTESGNLVCIHARDKYQAGILTDFVGHSWA
jgi:cutinase